MNHIKINENRYNLTDDGIEQNEVLKLQINAEDHTFERIKSDFECVKSITVYGTSESEDFESGYFEKITLKSVEYDLDKKLYIVKMSEIDKTTQRINDLEETVNFLLLGGNE